ncbi:MAG: DUF1565 domain-containing protein, partial [Deltaproteobacteria bacterium]|nr:DUF1565 domain-containing protein [Deltaproteobacteria bacterium]
PAPWRRLGDGTCEPVFPDTCEASQTYPTLGALPPDARVLHVRAGASEAAADGTETAPFPTINRALRGASGALWVRVAPGTYRENLILPDGVHLLGCRHRVTLEGVMVDRPAVAVVGGARAELVGFTVRSGGNGVHAQAGSQLWVSASDIVDCHGAGVLGIDVDALRGPTRVTLSDCSVEGTLSRPFGQVGGAGLLAERGGVIVVARTLVQRNRNAGVVALNLGHAEGQRSRVELTDSVVRGTLPAEREALGGSGLMAINGGEITATRTLVHGNQAAGVFAADAVAGTASRVALTDCVVRETLPLASNGNLGFGLDAQDGGEITALRTLLRGNRTAGAYAVDASRALQPSRVELTECVVRDTRSQASDRRLGCGVTAQSGGVVVARRSLLAGNRYAGALSIGRADAAEASSVELLGCVVRDSRPSEGEPESGWGATIQRGARLTLTGTLLLGNRGVGVVAEGAGQQDEPSRASLTGCVVRGTLPRSTGSGGIGLYANVGGEVSALRTLLDRNLAYGALSAAVSITGRPSRLELDACVVRDTLANSPEAGSAVGLAARDGGRALGHGTLVARSLGAGVLVVGVGPDGAPSRMELDRCIVRETLPRAADGLTGYGLTTQQGGRCDARETLLEENRSSAVLSIGQSPGGVPSHLVLMDSAVRVTRPVDAPAVLGIGLTASQGARFEAVRVLVQRSHEGGSMASGEGTSVTLEDVLFEAILPTNGRGGYGVAGAGGATVEARRVTVLGSHGAAFASAPSSVLRGAPRGSRVTVRDAFVRGVGVASLDYDPCDQNRPVGPPRAYGAHVGTASTLDLQRVLLADGDTAAAAFGGALTWTDGAAWGFRRYLVRGTSVVTPPLAIQGVVTQVLAVLEDPTLTDERLPEPLLDPSQRPGTCGAR